MTDATETTRTPDDYYVARMENGGLAMQPFCGCGRALNEDYYCDRCRKKCRCHRIVCSDDETLEEVRRYVRRSPQFSGFRVELAGAP